MIRLILAMVVALALVSGCGPAPSSAPVRVPSVPPESAPAPAPKAPALPAKPLWPEPGTHFAAERGYDSAHAYLPFSFKGQTVLPVQTPEGAFLTTREKDDVFLVGKSSVRGGVELLPQPQLLFHLPHTVGQTWTAGTVTYKVTEITEADTPAGKLQVVVVAVSGKSMEPRTEVWAPGYGLVKLSFGERTTYTAARVVDEVPRPFPALGRPEPNVTALLVDGGSNELILDGTGKELGRILLPGARDTVSWRRIGAVDFAWHTSPVSAMAVTWTAYVYQGGQFRRAQWTSPDWNQPYLPVAYSGRDGEGTNVEFRPDGTILYKGIGSSDGKTYLFRWDSAALTFRGELQK